MSLVLEIEYLGGVAYAAVSPDSEEPDWPPQPDRVFSALVASWAARGKCDAEAAALRWIEALPPPAVLASATRPRTSPLSFVPANDASSAKGKHALHVMPQSRNRQPRRFPASRPDEPVVRFFWPGAKADGERLAALQALAADTSYIGHSASLTRCRFVETKPPAAVVMRSPHRAVYSGRLDELEAAFARGHRPPRGTWVQPVADPEAEAPGTAFDPRWLVLEPVDDTELPDVRAAGLATKAIRDRLAAGYEQAGLRIPEVVSGRSPDGSPARVPHLAVVPMPFAGFAHADGHLLGFALVPPKGAALLDDADFLKVLRGLARVRPTDGRRIIDVELPAPGGRLHTLRLSPTLEPILASLDPRLYVRYRDRPARSFATVTPLVLDRHPKARGPAWDAEVAGIVAEACVHIGLPVPAPVETDAGLLPAVVVGKYSAVEGAVPAQPPGSAPPWMRWRLPPVLEGRILAHAVVRFAQPVTGPVILGAGRHFGLGLCRPIPDPGVTYE